MKNKEDKDTALKNFNEGLAILRAHPLFGYLISDISFTRKQHSSLPNYCPENGWAVAIDNSQIHVHQTRRGSPQEWAFVIAHACLHLAFEHFKKRERPVEWNAACCITVNKFLSALKVGRVPDDLLFRADELPSHSEETLYQEFCRTRVPDAFKDLSMAGSGVPDLWFASGHHQASRWAEHFANALQRAVSETIEKSTSAYEKKRGDSPAEKARAWFINNYPLLGALAASFEIIEDPEILRRMQISLGAVNAQAKEIYIDSRKLRGEELKFVMAHEILHAALRHDARRQGRDPYFWNIAADYSVNGWLIEMHIGQIPALGLLHDPALKGMNVETIYDTIVTDLRRLRKLSTFRGQGLPDIIEDTPAWWLSPDGMRLDEFYRQALMQGLLYHEEQGRGLLPASLIEEINALAQPPIPWNVKLGHFLDRFFQPIEKGRTFARPSRRQSSTPDIPRASWVIKHPLDARTFGVILDTSGSMDRHILAQALGAISSYAMSRDVPAVRVVFCDAMPYDQGYMAAEEIAGKVKVRGRGGTILQPGIDLLQNATDFPPDAPILIITDCACDILRLKREHAFLIPTGAHLPFPPAGEVFRID